VRKFPDVDGGKSQQSLSLLQLLPFPRHDFGPLVPAAPVIPAEPPAGSVPPPLSLQDAPIVRAKITSAVSNPDFVDMVPFPLLRFD